MDYVVVAIFIAGISYNILNPKELDGFQSSNSPLPYYRKCLVCHNDKIQRMEFMCNNCNYVVPFT